MYSKVASTRSSSWLSKNIFETLAVVIGLLLTSAALERPLVAQRTKTVGNRSQTSRNTLRGQTPNVFVKRFRGNRGDLKVEVELRRSGQNLEGTVLYLNAGGKGEFRTVTNDIRGTIDKNDNILLDEFDGLYPEGYAKWKGRFLTRTIIRGRWSSSNPPFVDWEPFILRQTTAPATETDQDLAEQAIASVTNYFETKFTKCGESYFVGSRNWGEQYQDGRFLIKEKGDQPFRKEIFFFYAARREYNGLGWSRWQGYVPYEHFVFHVSRIASRWVVRNPPGTSAFYPSAGKAKCSEMAPD